VRLTARQNPIDIAAIEAARLDKYARLVKKTGVRLD
jgi:hypothetical protein